MLPADARGPAASRNGLSIPDVEVLAHLSEASAGRLRSFALGQLLQWERSRLSQHLTRMERRGLVTRERCSTDQRGAFVVVTPEGRASSTPPPDRTWTTCGPS